MTVTEDIDSLLANGVHWKPHKNSEARRQSAANIVKVLVANRDQFVNNHLREMLTIALWKVTLADSPSKYKTRYCSQGSLASPGSKMQHEHVYTRKALIDELLAPNADIDAILSKAVGCTDTEEEHRVLSVVPKSVNGWDRYRAAGITVIDRVTRRSAECGEPGSTLPAP